MRERLEEEPEPDEPDEPDEPEAVEAAAGPIVPAVPMGGREFEYRTAQISAAQLADGKTLAEQLTKESADGWDLVEIVNAGQQFVLLLRKAKQPKKESRPVGFFPKGR